MERTRLVIVVVVVGVAAWLLLRSVGLVPHKGPEVVLLGDSITDQTKATFAQRLGDDWDVTATGVPGDRADQRLPDVPELASHHPMQVVVNLGTNDVIQLKPPEETIGALEQVASGFSGSRCVHLVTINDLMLNFSDVGLHDRAVALNDRIRELAARRGWGIVPWDQMVRDYNGGPQPDGPITSDTVHPTEVGQRMLADAYRRALASC
jgi:lysophospholipase L1-like esterase